MRGIKMDKILAIIIIFLGIIFSLVGVFSMGVVPKIFETSETSNETKQETANQTEIILKQFHRENNTTHQIISNQGVVIDKLNQSLENQRVMLVQLNKTVVHNQKDIELNLDISKEHKQVAKDHDIIQGNVQNVTEEIYELLKIADERNYQATKNNTKLLTNLTEALKEINILHKEIKELLESANRNTIS